VLRKSQLEPKFLSIKDVLKEVLLVKLNRAFEENQIDIIVDPDVSNSSISVCLNSSFSVQSRNTGADF
jgi:hypothetical protein